MPSATTGKKMFKKFSRKIRNQRRASAQALPASCSNVPDLVGDMASSHSILSKSVVPVSRSSFHSQLEEGNTRKIVEHISSDRLSDRAIDNDNQSNNLLKVRPTHLAGEADVHKRASLIGIPVELRIMIFKLVFPPCNTRGTAETTLYWGPNLRILGQSHSQLCRVNHQIYEETRGLLYGQTLVFLSHEALIKFSSTRTCQQMSLLRSICMKPRVTDWTGAIKTLVLPPGASLTVHWPITKNLWRALISNNTLDYRQVNVLSGDEGNRVVFEPATADAKRPTYEYLERTFNQSIIRNF